MRRTHSPWNRQVWQLWRRSPQNCWGWQNLRQTSYLESGGLPLLKPLDQTQYYHTAAQHVCVLLLDDPPQLDPRGRRSLCSCRLPYKCKSLRWCGWPQEGHCFSILNVSLFPVFVTLPVVNLIVLRRSSEPDCFSVSDETTRSTICLCGIKAEFCLHFVSLLDPS